MKVPNISLNTSCDKLEFYNLSHCQLMSLINELVKGGWVSVPENKDVPSAIINHTGGRLDKNTTTDIQNQWWPSTWCVEIKKSFISSCDIRLVFRKFLFWPSIKWQLTIHFNNAK